MDPREKMYRGRRAAEEGRYEDALRDYVWFHHHALEHQPSLYGVRLSFALSYWKELADAYPPAARKLKRIRDEKTARLAAGEGGRDLFDDVASINELFGEENKTYRLFLKLVEAAPALAGSCADLAIETIIAAKDFSLAQRYSPPPEKALLAYSESLNADLARLEKRPLRMRKATLDAFVYIYCNRVGNLIGILEGLGRTDEADYCREWAIALVETEEAERLVQKRLLPSIS